MKRVLHQRLEPPPYALEVYAKGLLKSPYNLPLKRTTIHRLENLKKEKNMKKAFSEKFIFLLENKNL